MKFQVFQQSRKGGREKNEDRMGYCYTREAGLFALADGMGGHPDGELAAQLALQTLSAVFQREARPALADPAAFLAEAVQVAHRQLLRHAATRRMDDTPRTTLVACVLQGDQAWWAHCGDSRLYHLRGSHLLVRTRDHSYAELQDSMSPLIGGNERVNRNVLFTCLGSPTQPLVDVAGPVALAGGDRLMLCSDGLWGNLPDERITALLAEAPLDRAVPALVERALADGGPRCDNVTVLGLQWEADGSAPGVSTQALGEDLFASTIQAELGPEPAPPAGPDDEAIDRSLREIEDALRRSSRARGSELDEGS